jgi:hypothetical protein
MWKCENVEMWRYENVEMWRCENVECGNVKIGYTVGKF